MDDHQLPPDLRRLFADGGKGRALAADLPPGEVMCADDGRPAFWMSHTPATGALWAALRAEHPRSGLWPLLLEESAQPWSVARVAPDDPMLIDHFTAEGFMAEVWQEWVAQAPEEALGEIEPFGALCPGLAEAGVLAADPDLVAEWYAKELAQRGMPIGLAAGARGADALVTLGWQGPLHHNEWIVPMAAVVRSWEDRFGARVVCLGFNTLEMSVAAPPTDLDHAVHVAAEHWAFCPDNILQGSGDLRGYAEEIVGRHAWSFWWD
ncbi:DUF4253 domain-containing protein [Thermoactinospora rubra]|uniref:DUF4253 domain-containing protein n=1 Tax=Thermoactinospora rubra TaxID=1088767 RepID=UPI000A1160D4|nr:DUF4253 domain-containing protein [Thermoactinospora rubra]